MAAGGGEELNLTPFIDLFSVLICFLLMTAAWLQLESLSTSIDNSTASEAPPPVTPPVKKAQLSVTLETGKVTLKEDEKVFDVPNDGTGMDKGRIKAYLADWKRKYPDRRDIVLNTGAGVVYGGLIGMYDLLIQSDWPDVGINPQ